MTPRVESTWLSTASQSTALSTFFGFKRVNMHPPYNVAVAKADFDRVDEDLPKVKAVQVEHIRLTLG